MINVYCCGLQATWVENVPGTGYNFCGECRQEVLTPLEVCERPKDGGFTPLPIIYGRPLSTKACGDAEFIAAAKDAVEAAKRAAITGWATYLPTASGIAYIILKRDYDQLEFDFMSSYPDADSSDEEDYDDGE